MTDSKKSKNSSLRSAAGIKPAVIEERYEDPKKIITGADHNATQIDPVRDIIVVVIAHPMRFLR
jgi:hypothetical protein